MLGAIAAAQRAAHRRMHDPSATPLPPAAAPVAEAQALFTGGPLLRLRSRLPFLRGKPFVVRRVLLFVLVAWFPLLVLASLGGGEGRPLLRDLGAFARYVIAGPLLLAAEVACLAVLGSIARQINFRPKSVMAVATAPGVNTARAKSRHHPTRSPQSQRGCRQRRVKPVIEAPLSEASNGLANAAVFKSVISRHRE